MMNHRPVGAAKRAESLRGMRDSESLVARKRVPCCERYRSPGVVAKTWPGIMPECHLNLEKSEISVDCQTLQEEGFAEGNMGTFFPLDRRKGFPFDEAETNLSCSKQMS